RSLSDEHLVLTPEPGAQPLQVGDKIRVVPGHCDPTVNLHDWIVAVRGNQVEQVWPVDARGALF
ncbi:MAG: DSD1 family PLP-dependent enzyme, partial [Quisquiliibacterium sp.]